MYPLRLRKRCRRASCSSALSLFLVTPLSTFSSLDLDSALLDALRDAGYETPTPIQAQAIPPLLDRRDVLGCAQTGTGKTAAFVLPILHRLLENPSPQRKRRPIRALILSPTRELAAQIGDSIEAYGRYSDIRHTVIFGGIKPHRQIKALRHGVDIVVATPGRLLDLERQGYVDLSEVEFFVLDEADRMLDMGFIRDIRVVLDLIPDRRQNLLFSATMPKKISELAHTFMHRPVQIEVTPPSTTVERIQQAVCFVDKAEKKDALVDAIQRHDVDRAIIFTRTKHGANRLVRQLENTNIPAQAIHGNKSQSARERALSAFRDGDLRLLVATDIASRGIDVDGVSHVYVYDLPDEAEAYVHRIGRTGRAGREGISLTFCTEDQRDLLDDVLRVTQEAIPIVNREGEEIGRAEVPTGRSSGKKRRRGGGGGGGRRGGGGQRGSGRSGGGRGGSSRRGASSQRDRRGGGGERGGGQSGGQGDGENASGGRRQQRRRKPRGAEGGGAASSEDGRPSKAKGKRTGAGRPLKDGASRKPRGKRNHSKREGAPSSASKSRKSGPSGGGGKTLSARRDAPRTSFRRSSKQDN